MRSIVKPATLQGRTLGESFGLSVHVVTDPIQRGTSISAGSFGWNGAYNTHFWVDPKEKVVAVMMTPDRQRSKPRRGPNGLRERGRADDCRTGRFEIMSPRRIHL